MQIYNSLTQKKQTFTPIEPGKVRLYVCGMTVYDFCHAGHARAMIAFDCFVRYLRSQNYEVTYVRNITDIDDKIIKRAAENNESIENLTERFIDAMTEDWAALGCLPPDFEPRATDHIPEMLDLIQKLVEQGFAYQTETQKGDVYFAVDKFKDYGKLSHRDLEKLRAGARVDVVTDKKDPVDFVLWKMAKPGEPAWDSPWGRGRPGWHIECSAMASKLLGKPFDIHGGGVDLMFPHHENEIAQSEAGCDHALANYWMHSGHLTINDIKMSKSLGNFFTIREVLKEYPAEVVRYFYLSSHYRSPLNYSRDNLDNAHEALVRFYTAINGLDATELDLNIAEVKASHDKIIAALDDDFNTPVALAELFSVVRAINKAKTEGDIELAKNLVGVLKYFGDVFGILQLDPETFIKGDVEDLDVAKIEALIKERDEVRTNKDWARADAIRDELQAMKVQLEDGSDGVTWKRL